MAKKSEFLIERHIPADAATGLPEHWQPVRGGEASTESCLSYLRQQAENGRYRVLRVTRVVDVSMERRATLSDVQEEATEPTPESAAEEAPQAAPQEAPPTQVAGTDTL